VGPVSPGSAGNRAGDKSDAAVVVAAEVLRLTRCGPAVTTAGGQQQPSTDDRVPTCWHTNHTMDE